MADQAWIILLSLCQWVYFTDSTGAKQQGYAMKEYCENESFRASCDPNHVVLVNAARFGRMREGRCITSAYGKIGCGLDVQGLMDHKCSGQPKCDVIVSKLVPEERQLCPRDFRSYLEANYTCLPVMNGSSSLCQNRHHVKVTSLEGYLSSHVAETSRLGSLDCPWLLEASPGQTIRLSIIDFSWASNQRNDPVCHVYTIIKETAVSTAETVCADTNRSRDVYSSITNVVEVRLVKREEWDGHFLIKFKTLGCADPVQPRGGWVRRYSNRADFGCTYSDRRWTQLCTGNTWTGASGNCSDGISTQASTGVLGGFAISSSLSIVVIILIAVAIGVGILVFGLVCLRRQQRPPPQSRTPPPPYDPYYSRQSSQMGMTSQLRKSTDMLDAYAGAENKYHSTLPHRHQRNDLLNTQRPPMYDPYTDHIYEDPNFDNKDYRSEGISSVQPSLPVQYYELESESLAAGGGGRRNGGEDIRRAAPSCPSRFEENFSFPDTH